VLTASQAATRRRRPPVSPRQQYQQWLLDRIEDYKEQIPRDELLRLGDEAAAELSGGADGQQYLLTEVLMADTVDRLIAKRLRLKSFSRWRQQFLKLREAQRAPTHWGIDTAHAVATMLPRIEPGDQVLAVGRSTEAAALLLLAHDATVTFLSGDLGTIERVESRVRSEALNSHFTAYLAQLGEWLPTLPGPVDLVVIEVSALAELPHARRQALIHQLQEQTRPGGVHALFPGETSSAPEGFLSHYPEWERTPLPAGRKGARAEARGLLVTQPEAGWPTGWAEPAAEMGREAGGQ
jgi:hypothetical protein